MFVSPPSQLILNHEIKRQYVYFKIYITSITNTYLPLVLRGKLSVSLWYKTIVVGFDKKWSIVAYLKTVTSLRNLVAT